MGARKRPSTRTALYQRRYSRPNRPATTAIHAAYPEHSKNQEPFPERAGLPALAPARAAAGGGSGWHLHVDSSDDAPWAEWFLTSSCLALAVLLADRQAPPAGLCASHSCGKPFVNVGRGAARRYCSATCGSRERVARHRTSETGAP